jgi:Acyl dehydratase
MAGLYFEDCVVDHVLRHALTRTVTETDNLLFTALTMNPQPLHLDEEFAKESPFGTRIVNSVFTLGLVVGIPVGDVSLGTTLGNLGFEDVRFPAPVRIGDTLHVQTRVVSKRESQKWPNAGIVVFEHTGFNQRDEVVASIRRAGLMLKRPAVQG